MEVSSPGRLLCPDMGGEMQMFLLQREMGLKELGEGARVRDMHA